MTKICMQPSPSRRNNNRGSQPMRTMLGKQRCMPYACARWFPCVRRCMDMYGYMFMDECLHTQSQTHAHTYMWQMLTDLTDSGGCTLECRFGGTNFDGMDLTERNYFLTDFDGLAIYFDGKALFFDGFTQQVLSRDVCTLKVLSRDVCTPLS